MSTLQGMRQREAETASAAAEAERLAQQKQQQADFRDKVFAADELLSVPPGQRVDTIRRLKAERAASGLPTGTYDMYEQLASEGTPEARAQFDSLLQSTRRAGYRVGLLEQPAARPTTEDERTVAAMGFTPGTKEYAAVLVKLKQDMRPRQPGLTVTTDPVTGTTVSFGEAGALEKPVKKDLQAEIIAGEKALGDLDRIGEQFRGEFLTYGGRLKSSWGAFKSKAGAELDPEEKQLVRDRRAFADNVNRAFNSYRKEITGAAASVQELESLRRAMFNTEQSPEEFQASFGEFQRQLNRHQRLRRKILREGLSGPQAGKKLDFLFARGEDDDPVARGEELRKAGLNDEQAASRLLQEGYF
jgi:hypothetical protein